MNKAVTVLHCDRFCIIIANCPSPHTNPTNSALSLAMHYILASLVKGSWIDGKAQTVALLLSACDMPTLFILQTFLPSRRRDCTPSAPSIRFSALSPSLFVGERLCVLSWLCVHCNRGRLRSVRPAPTFCDHL